ncbi:hypothetical protein K5E_21970 [Enterococcus thailandicus]|uniref:hypothetical protein n=1 Tax=Enterococcus thailandicus TaxID=417368 RepID=UPI00244D9510|nr:hypothetical protein [Enterococcus thailandicus]GMC02532.1 hypothetical protein K4E_00420 [Enterococcus thailandicus]GMC10058.1 hypothetical protein K5E_21970 [Enterococcus thailandicus]
MQDKKKIKLIWGIGIGSVVIIFSVLIFMGIQLLNGSKQIDAPQMNQKIEIESQSTNSSNSDITMSHDSSETSEREINSTDRIKKFLNVYFTWELEEGSIDDRAKSLKELMSEELYAIKSVEADSEALKELIKTYEETKEINTSNSIQLVSSRYISSKIYQDTNDSNLYRVNVKLEQKAPYQKSGAMTDEDYTLHFENDKVTQIEKVNNQLGSETSESN